MLEDESIKELNKTAEECIKEGNHDLTSVFAEFNYICRNQEGISHLAKKAGVGRESLYKTFSGKVKPKISTLIKLAKGLGLKINITFEKSN